MSSSHYSCLIIIRPGFSQQIFEEYSDVKLRENPSGVSPAVLFELTDMLKVKVNFNLEQAAKTQKRSTGIALLFA
jgi:hypothetical protein